MGEAATPANLCTSMHKASVETCVVLPISPAVSAESILEVCENVQGLIPLLSLDLHAVSADAIGPKIQAYKARYPFYRGVKFHPNLQNIDPVSDKACESVVQHQSPARTMTYS